ncbi:MAG: AI-2E family transporter [Desulfamplus sp.]|nr:AI-2E family transporter [Desulfamplus sp.]MBF0388885.1 AI-2E family transporter [Desulfamplus sp.]
MLRSFFLLIFLTFVFAYIQVSIVSYIQKWRGLRNRQVRVVVTGLALLCFFISVMLFLIPSVKKQTEVFISQFGTYINRVDQEILRLSHEYPSINRLIVQLELVASNSELNGNGNHKSSPDNLETAIKKQPVENGKSSPVITLLQKIIGIDNDLNAVGNINQILDNFRNISGKIASIGSAFLLSLLFSFLIVLDLPNLTLLIKSLEQTKLNFFYKEVAGNIRNFGEVLGKALEAQLSIAIMNSILTAIGLYILGIGKYIAFLSVIVFFCSFIPIVGVFISSIPICLIALQASGLNTMLVAIIFIIIIHLIEGYILNPRIYGSYMRINPVLVLIILTIGGKLFHIWGLVLGVPVCTYIFAHAIKKDDPKLSFDNNQTTKP